MHDGVQLDIERDTKKQALAAAYRAVFAGPLGEQVLRDICEQAAVFATMVDMMSGAVSDPATHGFHEGKRALALRILKLARADMARLAPWAAPQPVPGRETPTGARVAAPAKVE